MKCVSSVILVPIFLVCLSLISADTLDPEKTEQELMHQRREITLRRAEELLKQFPALQLQVEDLQNEVNELKALLQNKQGCVGQDDSHRRTCDSEAIRKLEEAQSDSHALIQMNKQSVEENTEDITHVNTTLTDATNKLLNEVEDIHRCLETKCSLDQKKSIKRPSFVSRWFLIESHNPKLSEFAIEHGLNELPVKVDVQVKSVSGAYNDWIFTGAPAIQSDDDTGEEYGGVFYLYNETHVILRAPTTSNDAGRAFVVFTGNSHGFFEGNHQYTYSSGLVRIKVWLQEDFPEPAYASKWHPLDIKEKSSSFHTIRHGLSKYPALVVLQVRANNLISEGIGSTMDSLVAPLSQAGGVLYGYDDKMVRVWTSFVPDTSSKWFGRLFGERDGWGSTSFGAHKGEFMVKVWSMDSFDNSKFHLKEANIEEADTGALSVPSIDLDNDLVSFSVQALTGANEGFLFKGWGSSQATRRPFGGAIYAYNKQGHFQVWRPNADKQGYLIHINGPYGAGSNSQASNSASYVATLLQADTESGK